MNNACHSDFCQTLERILTELGSELTAPGLTAYVATDWATGASHKWKNKLMNKVANIVTKGEIVTMFSKVICYRCDRKWERLNHISISCFPSKLQMFGYICLYGSKGKLGNISLFLGMLLTVSLRQTHFDTSAVDYLHKYFGKSSNCS